MHVTIHEVCDQCPNEDPKIITIFSRQRYCGRACYSEGEEAYRRMIRRFKADAIDNGECNATTTT